MNKLYAAGLALTLVLGFAGCRKKKQEVVVEEDQLVVLQETTRVSGPAGWPVDEADLNK